MGNCQSCVATSWARLISCCKCGSYSAAEPRDPKPVPVIPLDPLAEAATASDPAANSDPVPAEGAEELPVAEMLRMPLPKPPSETSGIHLNSFFLIISIHDFCTWCRCSSLCLLYS